MVSRVGFIAILLVAAGIAVSGAAARTPPTGTAMFLVEHDPRLCPSPLCGGYWVVAGQRRADALRRRAAADALLRRARRRPLRPAICQRDSRGLARPWRDRARTEVRRPHARPARASYAVYAPAGTAAVSGGYYRVVDNGIRCIRAPCFSYRAGQVNGSSRVTISQVDLQASGAPAGAIERAQAALRTKDGVYARGRFATTPDGGRVFRALRLYLRAPQPRA